MLQFQSYNVTEFKAQFIYLLYSFITHLPNCLKVFISKLKADKTQSSMYNLNLRLSSPKSKNPYTRELGLDLLSKVKNTFLYKIFDLRLNLRLSSPKSKNPYTRELGLDLLSKVRNTFLYKIFDVLYMLGIEENENDIGYQMYYSMSVKSFVTIEVLTRSNL